MGKILGFDLPFNGALRGRILWEALAGNTANNPVVSMEMHVSGAAPSGNATVLLYQTLGDERYYDAACLVTPAVAATTSNRCQ